MKRISALCCVFLLVACSFLMMGSSTNNQAPISLADTTAQSLVSDQIYHAEELIVVDSYASHTSTDITGTRTVSIQLLVAYLDSNGEYVFSSMTANGDMDIWEDVQRYCNNASMNVGEYVLNCYVRPGSAPSGKELEYFNESISYYGNLLGTEAVASRGLRYICDHTEDPYVTAKKQDTTSNIGMIFGGVAFLGAIWFAFIYKPNPRQNVRAQQKSTAKPQQRPQTYQPSVQNTPVVSPSSNSVIAQVDYYKQLLDRGYITEEEYNKKRRELLNL